MTCLVVSDGPDLGAAISAALAARGTTVLGVGPHDPFDAEAGTVPVGFEATADLLDRAGPLTALVVALGPVEGAANGWEQLVEAHRVVRPLVLRHAAWATAAGRVADQPLRIVHVTPAHTAAGRTAAQAVAQLARSATDTPSAPALSAYAIALESGEPADLVPLAALAARLATADDVQGLAGAELVVSRGWFGLRSHPQPSVTVSYGGPQFPDWLDETLRELAGTA